MNVQKANSFLSVVSEDIPGIKFWKHWGLIDPEVESCGPTVIGDGVHLTWLGQVRYYKSIRGAILFVRAHM